MTFCRKTLAVCLLSMIALTGCGSNDFKTAKTVGVVLCKGKPVANAAVYFEPIAESRDSSALVGKQGFAFTDAEGRFEISTYKPGQADGAVVGKHRVRVGRADAECDCAMNDEEDLMKVEIQSGETNEFELVLREASARDRQREAMMADEDDDEDE